MYDVARLEPVAQAKEPGGPHYIPSLALQASMIGPLEHVI
jgi:hypothetical protein